VTAATVLSPFFIENGISDICCFRGDILSHCNCSVTLIFAVLLPFLFIRVLKMAKDTRIVASCRVDETNAEERWFKAENVQYIG